MKCEAASLEIARLAPFKDDERISTPAGLIKESPSAS